MAALQSDLFTKPNVRTRLQACADSHASNIHQGHDPKGDWVSAIQIALMTVLGNKGIFQPTIDRAELETGTYGPTTETLVYLFKNEPSVNETGRKLLGPGQTDPDRIVGRQTITALDNLLPRVKPPDAPAPVVPPADPKYTCHFYHGTSLDNGRKLMGDDLGVRGTGFKGAADWDDFTDFGKGFYCHPHATRKLAVERAKKHNDEWSVLRLSLTADALNALTPASLYFADKASRPANAPQLAFGVSADWLEFVMYNRGFVWTRRPNDNDWTGQYAAMKGPLWVPRDSGFNHGPPLFPAHVHQVNWGRAGLDALNQPEAKRNRFLFTKDTEHLLGLSG